MMEFVNTWRLIRNTFKDEEKKHECNTDRNWICSKKQNIIPIDEKLYIWNEK